MPEAQRAALLGAVIQVRFAGFEHGGFVERLVFPTCFHPERCGEGTASVGICIKTLPLRYFKGEVFFRFLNSEWKCARFPNPQAYPISMTGTHVSPSRRQASRILIALTTSVNVRRVCCLKYRQNALGVSPAFLAACGPDMGRVKFSWMWAMIPGIRPSAGTLAGS